MANLTIEAFRSIYEEWKASGLSVQQYCENIGMRENRFCSNHDATEASAVIYTFIGCCNIAGVDVRTWLKYFLTHVHDYDTDYLGGSY